MSKHQSSLLKRMVSAKEIYTKSMVKLDNMLLRRLHRDGVYTPDQFDKIYVTRQKARKEAENYVKSKLDENNMAENNEPHS